MAIDRVKVQKQAEGYMASGKIDRAIDEFLKLLEDKGDDFNLVNRVGDAYLQVGKVPDALAMFKRAGIGYERNGFTNKAAAVFKKAHRTAPEDVDVALRLAETYRATNMIKDAIQVHIEMAELYTKKGLLKRALEEFAKVVELDPKNLKNKVKLADLYNKEGMKERASDIYLEVAESLAFEQMHAEALQILDRAKVMTTSPKLFLTQSRLCIMQKDLVAATQHLREGLSANPRSIELLEALAEVELQAKAPDRALEVIAQIPQISEKTAQLCERALRDMAKANTIDEGLRLFKPIGRDFARRGLGEQASRVLQSAFQGRAMSVEGWIQLAEISHQSGDQAGRISSLTRARALAIESNDSALIRSLETELQGLGVATELIPAQSSPAPIPHPEVRLSPVPDSMANLETTEVDPVRRLQIQQLQREGENYLRSRFNDRAQDCYQKILELDPANLDAITRIAEILKASGVMTKVQQHYVKVAEKLAPSGQRQLAVQMLDRAEEIFPGSTRLHRRMLGLTDVVASSAAAPLAPTAPTPPLQPVITPESDAPISIALGTGYDRVAPPVAPRIPVEDANDLDVLIALDEGGYGGSVPAEPEAAPAMPAPIFALPELPVEPVPAPVPEPEAPLVDASDLQWMVPDVPTEELPVEEEPLEEIEPLELEPLSFVPKLPTVPTIPTLPVDPTLNMRAEVGISEDLASNLSDIDFQLDYGSPDEAKIEIQNALKNWPEHPELLARLELADEALQRLGHEIAPKSLAEDSEFTHSFFDLTDILGDSIMEPGEGEEMHDATNVVEKIHSVDELFNAFREGVEQQVKVDDYDTHYNLGIAYKEMMLIEPALEEFKKAMRDPERTLECCSMLAICEEAQGNLEGAINWLRQGIEAPGFPPEDSIGLQYDLGGMLLQLGRVDEAREHFLAVSEIDPDYREVAKRL